MVACGMTHLAVIWLELTTLFFAMGDEVVDCFASPRNLPGMVR